MTDICDLILDQHNEMRLRFAELDALRGQGGSATELGRVWARLRLLLDAHAEAEERVFYPALLGAGRHGDDETEDAISDHNEIRDAAAAAADAEPSTDEWWSAVLKARERNSTHMGEEERGALADARVTIPAERRAELGVRWQQLIAQHMAELAEQTHDKDPQDYIAKHTR